MNHQSLRLTPSNSPFFKNTTPRSPTKPRSDESGLRLKKIIGTTTGGVNGFDCLPEKRQFAYCAGSAAVVATVDEDLKVTQRFFRARPTAGSSRDGVGALPVTPTPNEARSRALGHVREHTIGGSPLGASSRDWSDSPSGKTATAKDRVKAATSIALSSNGRWVAIGETGYKPRVLLFSNEGETSEAPVCALSEHTFGVQALKFSPDSRYLASLGTVNDGFLYLWSIDDRTGAASLHSSNKCTVMINDMMWGGRNLLTVGLRFIKIWRPGDESVADSRAGDSPATFGTPRQKTVDFGNSILSPKQRVLMGKNSLLGDLLDCNFICTVPMGHDKAVICSDTGDVAILDDISRTQTLRAVASVNFAISTARVDERGCLHLLGASGVSQCLDLDKVERESFVAKKRDRRQTISPTKLASSQTPTVIATSSIANIVLEMDSRRNIRLTRSTNEIESSDVASLQLPAHNDSVVGVGAISSRMFPDADFFTFAGNGAVRLWSASGSSSASFSIPVESSADMYDQTNELRAAASLITGTGEYIVAGDRYGTLTILDLRSDNLVLQIRAHSAEIADVIAFKSSEVQLVATCGRDRTVQLFTWQNDQLDLIQTLDEHAAAVNGLSMMGNGERLLSYSQDRTVIVRGAMLRDDQDPASLVFVMTKSIALKSSPTSICPNAHEDEILVASMDRCIGLYNIKTGHAGFNFKCSDADGGEAVSMSKIAYEPSLNGNPAIIGIASSDKSVRLYSEYGSLIARDWGHTEGITDLAVLHSRSKSQAEASEEVHVVTVAADSTIFVWDTLPPALPPNDLSSDTTGATLTASNACATPLRPPLRKVISFSELSRFKREKSIDEGSESPTLGQRQHSPQRLRKKPSKISIAQAPKLEPAFRGGHARRSSLRKRSPSPPSPRTRKDTVARKPSLGMALRSKSTENVLNGVTSPTSTTSTGFGSMTASTESVCRTLRAYRKKLTSPIALDSVNPDTLRDLETELKLINEALGQRSPSKKVDEHAMAKALEQASEKIVNRLDERIKERVEDELRKSTDATSSAVSTTPNTTNESSDGSGDIDAIAGALEQVALDKR